MRSTQMPGLYIMRHEVKGRAVHAGGFIEKGDLIEVCPVIVFSNKDLLKIHQTHLHDYYFLWGKKREKGAIALGFGSLYNHSDSPNAEFEMDISNEELRFLCVKDIAPGEEIKISYIDSDFRNDVTLWF